MTFRSSLGICATALLVLATGCDVNEPYPPTPSTQAAQASEQLNSLPSLEETKVDVQAAIDEITSAATKVIPGIVWIAATNAGEGNCEAPYEQTDGRRYFLPNQVAERVSVSEDQWAELLQAAKAAAAKLEATDVQVMADQPGHHDVWFTGPAGVFIKFSYKGNMVVSGFTGCRLPGDKRTPSQ
jgi:glucose/arabinose dehydrogenase